MELKRMREQAINALKNLEKAQKETPVNKRDWDWAIGVFANERNAKRMIEIVDIAEKMTEEEKAQIRAVPVYQNDVRCLKQIKTTYGLSWNEIRMLIRSDI